HACAVPRPPTLSRAALLAFRHPSTTWPSPLSLHDALPICQRHGPRRRARRLEDHRRLVRDCDDPGAHAAEAGDRRLHLATDEPRSEEHTSELQSRVDLVCRLLLEKKNHKQQRQRYTTEEIP